MTTDNQAMLELLKENLRLLGKSRKTLILSVEKASRIGEKAEYSFEEMETFDSLTSKFGRTSDLYTQKVIRTLWALMREPYVPFIDLMNQCEKSGIIVSAGLMLEIRDLRNQITHEYIPEAIQKLIPEVIALSGKLEENIQQTEIFLKQRDWFND